MGISTKYPKTNRIGAMVSPPRQRSAKPSSRLRAAAPHHNQGERKNVGDGCVSSVWEVGGVFAIAWEVYDRDNAGVKRNFLFRHIFPKF